MSEIHHDTNPIEPPETSVSERIVIYLALAMVLLLVANVPVWIQGRESQTSERRGFLKYEGPILGDGYRLREEGRELEAGRSREDVKRAEQKFHDALNMFRKSGDQKGEASVLNDLGFLYMCQRKYDEAVENFEKSLEIKRKVRWVWGEGNSLAGLTRLYDRQGQYSKAVEYYEQAVAAYEKSGTPGRARGILSRSGHVYRSLRQHPKAAEHFEKFLQLISTQ